MGLEISNILEETAEDCTSWHFWDTTGTYDSGTNPGGYGAPNVEATDIEDAVLIVTPYGWTNGYVFHFSITNLSITDATVTAPDGTVTNIFSDLATKTFPFTEAEPFIIISDYMEMGTDEEITSSAYHLEYSVNDSTDSYYYESDELIVCQVWNCTHNQQADLDAEDCQCENGSTIELAMKAQIMLDSAIYAMENGDVEKSQSNLVYAKELCDGKCKNC